MPYSQGADARSHPQHFPTSSHTYSRWRFPRLGAPWVSHTHVHPLPSIHSFKARKATQSETAVPTDPCPHGPLSQDMAGAISSAAPPAKPPAHPNPELQAGNLHPRWSAGLPQSSCGRGCHGWVPPRREVSLLLVPGRHGCAQPVSAEKCRVGVEWGHQVWEQQERQKRDSKKVLRAPRSTGHQDPHTFTCSF